VPIAVILGFRRVVAVKGLAYYRMLNQIDVRRNSRRPGLLIACVLAGAGCESASPDYFPLENGRRWEYRTTLRVLDETTHGREIVRNVGIVEHAGKRISIFEYPGGARRYYARSAEGTGRVPTARGAHGAMRIDAADHLVLPAPIVAGASWELDSELAFAESVFYEAGERIRDRRTPVPMRYRIESTSDAVNVSNTVFTGCVRVRATGSAIVRVNQGANFGTVAVEHVDWYAPGVGLVRSSRAETSESPFLKRGEYLMELERWQ